VEIEGRGTPDEETGILRDNLLYLFPIANSQGQTGLFLCLYRRHGFVVPVSETPRKKRDFTVIYQLCINLSSGKTAGFRGTKFPEKSVKEHTDARACAQRMTNFQNIFKSNIFYYPLKYSEYLRIAIRGIHEILSSLTMNNLSF